MCLEAVDWIFHVTFYVIMGVVVNADYVLPYATLPLLLLFYTHLAATHLRRSYGGVKEAVFGICRQTLAPKYMEEFRAELEKDKERVREVAAILRAKNDSPRAMERDEDTHVDLIDVVGVDAGLRQDGPAPQAQLPKGKNYCHPLGKMAALDLNSQRDKKQITCRFVN